MYLASHSFFSLRYGVLSPDALAAAAAQRKVYALALTDINNTSAAYEFAVACRKHDVRPVFGIEYRKDGRHLYTGLAKNAEGIRELNYHLSFHSLNSLPLPERAPNWQHAFTIYPASEHLPPSLAAHEFIGVRPGMVNGLFSSALKNHYSHLVAFSPVTFLTKDDLRIHKLLRCIDQNALLGKLNASLLAHGDELFWTPDEMRRLYASLPELIHRAEKILDQCAFEMATGHANNRLYFTGTADGDCRLLAKLAFQGCRRRYKTSSYAKAEARVRRELQVISRLGFSAYFLITWDIVRYAQSAGYFHVGRGSGANSIVAFCLFITDVDPLELDLYFERFINPHRSSPPDFDIDFSWSDRDDVTEYIFERYGRDHTALLATYNTFKGKSICRELGKVFGLPKQDIDTIVDHPKASHKHHPFAKYIFRYGKRIEKFPNYLSIHAGGIIIAEKPLYYHTALMQMPKGFPIAHFDMYGAEDLGFHKFDILSQRGLGHIKDAVEIIKKTTGKCIDIHDIASIQEDPKVRRQLQSGSCIGCFYIESPAMRGLLAKLRCSDYRHLVAASSIIRPGVAQSGMMRQYIERFHHPEKIQYLHPVFEEHLKETFGVMVYQEDVMKIVHHFSGLDLDESDVLRRIMTGKKKNSDTFRALKEKYFANCAARGYSEALTKEVWRQIESFSGYSFCKAHSASYAVESFQSLFLKAHYPLEFMVAVINNFGGFYNTEIYVHEARMHGADIQAPCVNHSEYLTCIRGKKIYLGFVHIHSLPERVSRQIVHERLKHGAFSSLDDFIRRVPMGRDALHILIRIGALRFTGCSKAELMWMKNSVPELAAAQPQRSRLFAEPPETFCIPKLEESPYDQAFDEIEYLGFPLCNPFYLTAATDGESVAAREMKNNIGQKVTMRGYYVTQKPVTTASGKHMAFGCWLDEEGRFYDSIHFPPSLEKYPFRGRGCYWLKGVVVEDFGFPSLEVCDMKKIPMLEDERYERKKL